MRTYEPSIPNKQMQIEIDTRMVFNPEGTVLYVVVVCNRHCIYKVPYNAC